MKRYAIDDNCPITGECDYIQRLMMFQEGDLSWLYPHMHKIRDLKGTLGGEILHFMLNNDDGNLHVQHLCKILYQCGGDINAVHEFLPPKDASFPYVGMNYLIQKRLWKYLQYIISEFHNIDITIRNLHYNLLVFIVDNYWNLFHNFSDGTQSAIQCRKFIMLSIDAYCSRIPMSNEICQVINAVRQCRRYHKSRKEDDESRSYQQQYDNCKHKYMPLLLFGYLEIIPRDIMSLIMCYN